MSLQIIVGDLLEQRADAIVNPWNRNFIPWFLLLPHGVSGAIKKRGGTAPFRELCQFGTLKPGEAVTTGAGNLPFRAIIHVAGLNWTWTASEFSIRESTRNALQLTREIELESLAFPLIGAGTGGIGEERFLGWMSEGIERHGHDLTTIIARFGAQS